MREWVVDGSDGSAKSPILARVRQRLEEAGLTVLVRAPFAMVNAERVQELAAAMDLGDEELSQRQRLSADIFFLWADVLVGAPAAIDLLSRAIERGRGEAMEIEADVLLWDRHWLTAMGEIGAWPHLVKRWGDDLPPLFFLWAPPSQTRSSRRFSEEIPWTSSDSTMAETNKRLEGLCEGPYKDRVAGRFEVRSRTQDLGPIVETITQTILGGSAHR